jgi:CheY-like chemotaxis protein
MLKNINILLVEDEVITAMLMRQQLGDIGYPVLEHVTTGEKAIVSAKENPPDIILLDIHLVGEIDGIEVAKAIKAIADIPIIFITGYDDKEIKERAEKTRPLGFLIKPLDLFALKTILDAHFKQDG